MGYILFRFWLLAILLFPTLAFATEVKILQFNVYMLPWPIKSSLQDVRTKAIPAQLEKSDYDLMFFEEAFMPSFRNEMIAKLGKTYPYNFYLSDSAKYSQVFGSGIFVMSRHPFKVIDKAIFASCSGADCFAAKGSFVLDVTLPSGQRLQFAPTHMDAQGEASRVSQIAQVKQLLAKTRVRGVPQIFLGDLNINASKPEMNESLRTLGMTATQLVGRFKTTNARVNPCYATPTNAKWIDHVWVESEFASARSTLEVVPLEFENGGKICPSSDHHALEARLHFEDSELKINKHQ